MNYSDIASTLESNLSNIETSISNLRSTSLSPTWSGEASTAFTTDIEETTSLLETEKANLSKFIEILRNVEAYKSNKEQINSLNSHLSSLPKTEETANARNRLVGEINSLNSQNSTLAGTINSSLGNFPKVSSTKNIVNFSI